MILDNTEMMLDDTEIPLEHSGWYPPLCPLLFKLSVCS